MSAEDEREAAATLAADLRAALSATRALPPMVWKDEERVCASCGTNRTHAYFRLADGKDVATCGACHVKELERVIGENGV